MHIRGDGGIDKKGYVLYSNTNKELLNEFVQDAKTVFNIQNVCIVGSKIYLPKHVGTIFIEDFGYIAGLQIAHNLGIDADIFRANKETRSQAIRAYFDDEARFHSNAIEMVRNRDMGFLSKEMLKNAIQNPKKYYKYAPRFLHDLRELLDGFGIETSVPFFYKGDLLMHVDIYGFLRLSVPWRFLITGEENLRKYHDAIGFKDKGKMNLLENYIKNIKVHKVRRNMSMRFAIEKCMELQSKNGFITVRFLAQVSNRSIGHSRRWVYDLLASKRIKLVKGRTITHRNELGRICGSSDEFRYRMC